MLNKSKKLKIGNKEYNFKMTNRTILKIDEEYGNYGTVIEGIMEGKAFYSNAIKVLVCSCEQEINEDLIIDGMNAMDFNTVIPTFVTDLYLNYMGINETTETEGKKKEKN